MTQPDSAHLVTSRKPDDLPGFNAKMIDVLEHAAEHHSTAK
jgi:hypothetical protein